MEKCISSRQWCSIKKPVLEQLAKHTPVPELVFNKVAGVRPGVMPGTGVFLTVL